MADYWKSQPRKFCDFCKCWITDNKPSVDFHEKGKRHQENVEKKIGELRKKGQKDYEAKKKMDSDFRKMNEAALKAYEKDIKRDPSLARELERHKTIPESEPVQVNFSQERRSKGPPKPSKKLPKFKNAKSGNMKSKGTVKSWLEAKTGTGNTYFWNSESGETVWEEPAQGYVSLAEQQCQKNARSEAIRLSEGPVNKGEPYGKWVTVEIRKPEAVDLQLPVQKEATEFKVVVDNSDAKVSFKEKTISSLVGNIIPKDTIVTFKKRKFNADSKRAVRRKVDED